MPGTIDHPITVAADPQRVRVTFAGRVIADSTGTLLLREASFPEVVYFPRQDVDMASLTRTERRTHCPYKGEASYYSIQEGGRTVDNAVWSYEHPLADMAEIAGYLAFYPDRVDGIERLPR